MAETHTESTTAPLPPSPSSLPGEAAFGGLRASGLLLPPERADLQLFYDYLAAVRVVADTPSLEAETREFLFGEMELILLGHQPPELTLFTQPVAALVERLAALAMTNDAPLRLLQAARRDVARSSCPAWSDLMLYCRYAAEPLGRFALERHGVRSDAATAAMDALTAASLVLRLMRHAGRDWHLHGRCYLPTDWFAEEGTTPEHLGELKMNVGVRRVFDRMLERVDKLLEQAAPLPGLIPAPGLRGEVVRLMRLARARARQLRRRDALAEDLTLPALTRAWGYWQGWRARRRG